MKCLLYKRKTGRREVSRPLNPQGKFPRAFKNKYDLQREGITSTVGGVAKVGQKCTHWVLTCLLGADLSGGEGALKTGGLPMGSTDGMRMILHSGPLELPRTTLGKAGPSRVQAGGQAYAVQITCLGDKLSQSCCFRSLPGLPSPAHHNPSPADKQPTGSHLQWGC